MRRIGLLLASALLVWGCNSSSSNGGDTDTNPGTGGTQAGTTSNALFMVHVDGMTADGTKMPVPNVAVFLAPFVEPTENHVPTFGHEAPSGDPLGNTDADGNARIDIEGGQNSSHALSQMGLMTSTVSLNKRRERNVTFF